MSLSEEQTEEQQFNAEVDKLKIFCNGLSEEEKQEIIEDLDLEYYNNNFVSAIGIESALQCVGRMLEECQKDLDIFRKKKELQTKVQHLTLPKLLVRYSKLPELFRTYVKVNTYASLNAVSEIDFSNVHSDDLFVAHAVGTKCYAADKNADLEELEDFVTLLKSFDKYLTEVETELVSDQKRSEDIEEYFYNERGTQNV